MRHNRLLAPTTFRLTVLRNSSRAVTINGRIRRLTVRHKVLLHISGHHVSVIIIFRHYHRLNHRQRYVTRTRGHRFASQARSLMPRRETVTNGVSHHLIHNNAFNQIRHRVNKALRNGGLLTKRTSDHRAVVEQPHNPYGRIRRLLSTNQYRANRVEHINRRHRVRHTKVYVIHTKGTHSRGRRHHQGVVRHRLLLRLIMGALRRHNKDHRGQPTSDLHSTYNRHNHVLLNGTNIRVVQSNAFARVANSTVQAENNKKSSRRSQLIFRAKLRQDRNRLAMMFTHIGQLTRHTIQVLPVVHLTLTNVQLQVNLITSIKAVLHLNLVTRARTLNNISVRRSKVISVLRIFGHHSRHIRVITLLRVAMIGSRHLRRVRLHNSIQHTRANGVTMRTARVLNSQRLVIISSSSRVATLFNDIIRSFRDSHQTRQAITSSNSSITSFTYSHDNVLRVAYFNGATNGKSKHTNVTRRRKVVLTFRQVNRAHRLTRPQLIRVHLNTPNGRLIRMTLIKSVRGRAIA